MHGVCVLFIVCFVYFLLSLRILFDIASQRRYTENLDPFNLVVRPSVCVFPSSFVCSSMRPPIHASFCSCVRATTAGGGGDGGLVIKRLMHFKFILCFSSDGRPAVPWIGNCLLKL